MTNKTSWVAGAGVGLSWSATGAPTGTEMASLASGSAIFGASTVANGTNLDIYADISVELTIGSATPAAGSYLGLYLARLNQDGTTYGDGSYVLGTQKALLPPWQPIGIIPLQSTNATTLLCGAVQGIIIPPDTFAFGIYNGSGITFSATAGNNVFKSKTYNLNLNA
jgi:hypothetical protein